MDLIPVGILLGAGFGWLAFRLRFLDRGGAVAGGLLAASVVGLGGAAWAVPSFVFFLSSSLVGRLGGRRKREIETRYEKGDVRDVGQVLANGGVGWVLLLVHVVFPADVLYWGFLGAFAAAAADTWATEVGVLGRAAPRHVSTGRRVPPGTSGAVSIAGTAGALAGAALVSASAWPFVDAGGAAIAIVSGAGLAGSFVDSVAGATVQAQYRDPATGEVGERSRGHRLVRGLRWVDNDRVNLLCTAAGAALAMICFRGGVFGS